MKEIKRNTDIKIRVGQNECSDDAIDRFMTRRGFQIEKFVDGKDLVHKYYYNREYYRLWVSFTNYITDTRIVFQLNGDIN